MSSTLAVLTAGAGSLPTSDDPSVVQVADYARALVAGGAALLVGLALAVVIRVVRTPIPPPRLSHMPPRDVALVLISLALLGVSAFGTEVGQLGRTVTWRLAVNVLGVVIGLVGTSDMLRRLRRHGRPGA